MSFAGKYVMTKRENYEKFAAASGASPDQIQRSKDVTLTTEVEENGDTYVVRRIYPAQTVTNTFTVGQTQEFSFAEGKKAPATASREGNKLMVTGPNFSQVSEIVDGQLKETLTFKGESMIRYSKRA